MAKRFDVLTPRAKKDGGTFWHRVGTAWEGDKGVNIVFDSLPMPDAEGRCSVSLFEPRENAGGGQQRGAGQNRDPQAGKSYGDLDDSVPY
jgi:hypothetical protein